MASTESVPLLKEHRSKAPGFLNLRLSLKDLLGKEYVEAVCGARASVTGADPGSLLRLASEKIDFFPASYRRSLVHSLSSVGRQISPALTPTSPGAATASFRAASRTDRSPLAGWGWIRVGEDGRAYLIAKSEHYHASLGHSFPGYRLIDLARQLGVPNATHNNTRGYITRKTEEELIRVANGVAPSNRKNLGEVLESEEPHLLNRVINLETGSLAVEAGLKMMLSRFLRAESARTKPVYAGRIPVILVVGDKTGGATANYHGTTLMTQMLRGMWPEIAESLEEKGVLAIRSLKINDLEDFKSALRSYDEGRYKVAGFLHEIVLMNYGGIRLSKPFLQEVYRLCRQRDIPILVDEIQSCAWSPELLLYREYGLSPDFVALGKGFSGGEYPASRILTTPAMDNLEQFDALVTNGQEELASLAYLVTLSFVEKNREAVERVGRYYEEQLASLARRHSRWVLETAGLRHLGAIFFDCADNAALFASLLNEAGIDISAQTYKVQCPPSALTKLPLTATFEMVDFLIREMERALLKMGKKK
jgi:acetylornithine/succinyldiaminopimelate/putrescine aminotransferase